MMPLIDLAVLALHAAFMLLMTVYAAHAYLMLYLYRRNIRRPQAVRTYAEWPRITVQLPIYNECYVVSRIVEAACGLDYPRDRLEIQVLDDSTDETRDLARNLVARFRGQGLNIRCLHRDRRDGYKAGALKAGLAEAAGEFVAIFDADFLPAPDFLRRLMPYFAADDIGLVQARWTHLNDDFSLLTRAQAIGLDAHFVLEQGARNASGIFINFNGTAGIWRKRAILESGNWQGDTLTEDMDLSYRAQMAGWRFVYANDVVCPAEIPAEIAGLKSQQYRWAKGAIQTAQKLLPSIWRSRTLPGLLKFEATVHLTNHLAFPALLGIALISFPMLLACAVNRHSPLFIAIALISAVNVFSYPIFYLVAQRALYTDWKRRSLFLPVLMAGAAGLSITVTQAVFSGLFGRTGEFVRTPKFNLAGRQPNAWRGRAYRSRIQATVLGELGLGLYLAFAAGYAALHLQVAALPFLALFGFGFAFIGGLSLAHAVRR